MTPKGPTDCDQINMVSSSNITKHTMRPAIISEIPEKQQTTDLYTKYFRYLKYHIKSIMFKNKHLKGNFKE